MEDDFDMVVNDYLDQEIALEYVSCMSKQIGNSAVPKYAVWLASVEILARLNNNLGKSHLCINEERNGFQIDDEPTILSGLECNDVKYMCAHPNMTFNYNQIVVVMDQSEAISVRHVEICRDQKQKGFQLYPFQKGVKLIDTFPVVDTGNVVTFKKDFSVVSLRQGASEGERCTVSLEIWSKEDINLMRKETD